MERSSQSDVWENCDSKIFVAKSVAGIVRRVIALLAMECVCLCVCASVLVSVSVSVAVCHTEENV